MTGKIFNQSRYTSRRKILRQNQTQPEQVFWQLVRAKQLGVKFRRQHSIGNYIVDFYAAEIHLVVEIDGDSHFTEEGQEYDNIREAYLTSLNLDIVRFTNTEILQNIEGVYHILKPIIDEKQEKLKIAKE